MKTLFERLSKENQEKILGNKLAKERFEKKLSTQSFIHEMHFEDVHHIYYFLFEEVDINPAKFYELFNNN